MENDMNMWGRPTLTKVGFIGLGKLGYPVAVAMQVRNHDVMGYDINLKAMNNDPKDYIEKSLDHYRVSYPIKFGNLHEVAEHSDIIFVAVQTPHDSKYEGITRIPEERIDFDYSYLEECLSRLSAAITKETVVVIISTVLPGTFKERLLPLVNHHIKLCYNPLFIAMGTVIDDFHYPEFVLLGVHSKLAAMYVENFYKTINRDVKVYTTTVENAELIKVAYNTFIGMKITFANVLMEICHKIDGCDVDAVTDALKLATDRVISPKYFSGGMGDGGGCHPRDNIALSALAQKLDLSYDWFENVMLAREKQTEWLADLIEEHIHLHKMSCIILGFAFKEGTNLDVGSPALLLNNLLWEKDIHPLLYDPHIDDIRPEELDQPHVFFIGAKHQDFYKWDFPAGSVVIDPWRYLKHLKDNKEIKYIPVGE